MNTEYIKIKLIEYTERIYLKLKYITIMFNNVGHGKWS